MSVMLERWNDDRMDGLEAKFDGLEAKFDGLERKVDLLEVKVDGLAERFEQVDRRFEQVDQRFERVETELLEQRREMRAGFAAIGESFERLHRLMFQGGVAMIVALVGLLATRV